MLNNDRLWELESGSKLTEAFTGTIVEYVNLRVDDKTKVKATPASGGAPVEIVISAIKLGEEIVGQTIETSGGMVSEYKGARAIMVYPKECKVNSVQLVEPGRGNGQTSRPAGQAPTTQGSTGSYKPKGPAYSEADANGLIERMIEKYPWITQGEGPRVINTLLIALGDGKLQLNPGVDVGGGNIDLGSESDEVPV